MEGQCSRMYESKQNRGEQEVGRSKKQVTPEVMNAFRTSRILWKLKASCKASTSEQVPYMIEQDQRP